MVNSPTAGQLAKCSSSELFVDNDSSRGMAMDHQFIHDEHPA